MLDPGDLKLIAFQRMFHFVEEKTKTALGNVKPIKIYIHFIHTVIHYL